MAASKSRAVFDEDDDTDSVKTDSTVESDFEAEYSVEKILAERKTDQGTSQYLVKWEGYELHRSTWEPPENFVDLDCLVNWKLQKRDIAEGRAKPFKVAKFDAAVRLDTEQRERRHAKRAEKRQLKEARGPTPRRRLLPRKDLTKKGTARKAPARNVASASSSATERSPRKQTTPLFEPSSPSGSVRKRKRPVPGQRSPSPALSVNDVSNSQYSMFNEPATTSTGSPRKSSSSHSTAVPKRARVNDSSDGKEATKQRSGTATTVVTSRPKPSNASSVQKKPRLSEAVGHVAASDDKDTERVQKKPRPTEAVSQVAASKDKDTERILKEAVSSSSRPLTKSSTVPDNLASRLASNSIPAATLTKSRDDPENKNATATTTVQRHDPAPSNVVKDAPRSVARTAGPARRAPISMFIEPTAKRRQRQRVNEYTAKDSTASQFVNLSTQARMQSYSRNEPPPDASALTFIDLNTSKVADANNETSSTTNALRVDTNVARTSDAESSAAPHSAPTFERRSVSVAEPQREVLQRRLATTTPRPAQVTEPRIAYPSARTDVPHLPPRKSITCRFGLKGTCKRSEESCHHAHIWTGQMAPKSAIVCTFWVKGNCKYSDEECEYYHTYDFPRNVDVGRRDGLEDANGFRAMQQARRRSESPDHSGLRQDEVEGRRGRVSLPHVRPHPDERTPIQSPSLASTTSFEPRRDPHTEDITMNDLNDEPPTNVAPAPNLTVATSDALNDKDTADPVDMCLTITPASQPSCTLDVKLVFDAKASRTKFLDAVGENSSLEGSEVCRSRDFEAYWFSKDMSLASGGVVCKPGDAVAIYLEDFLVLHSSSLVIRNNDFMFVVYPTKNPDWGFMPHRGPDRPGLRWYLQAPMPGTLDPIIIKPSKSSFTSMCAEHLGLNPETLFAGNRGKRVDRVVYLFFPKGTLETKLVEVFLNEIGAKFFYSEDCDLWTQFCGKGSTGNRVILIHPSMNAFWKIPDFWNVLVTGMNIFQVGVSKSIKLRPNSPPEYDCTRLFPSGTLTLITDDIFRYHPAEALRVLSIYEGYKIKPEGGRTDRIYCRPGILAWLAELMDEDREKGILAEDSPRVKCWQLVFELLGIPTADNNRNPFRSDLNPPPMLYSPPKSEMPSYGPMWDSSEEEATDFLVNWFAGHAVEECENYRRFNVLYEQHGALLARTPGLMQPENPKDPKEWMKRYTHIKITTPARFVVQVENYEKSKKVPL